ncbi:two-component system sensor histidine kinase [Indibacter alkaliphilus LW1]|uniref:histidine kinase n=1 Tax=Indibacter alkaliphilus (strain CCUG 57479 / KCTC 22604 / LW1) TaxID=1189612 RepID=S2DNY5_INDAL|nr:HAMP domain-containing sensor histidine kinase [Indibacter alkaliphilus]EOZ98920.1 two-component system sensor histidine kinase [Indibacter alkaliphilus LW1]
MKYNNLLFIISLSVIFAVSLQVYRIVQNYHFQKTRVAVDLQNNLNHTTDLYFQEMGKKDILTVKFTPNQDSSPSEISTNINLVKALDSILNPTSPKKELKDELNIENFMDIKVSSSKSKSIKATIIRDTLDQHLFEMLFVRELIPYNHSIDYEIIHINENLEPQELEQLASNPENQVLEAKSVFIPKGQRIFLQYTNHPKALIASGIFDISISMVFIALIVFAFMMLFRSLKTQKEIDEGQQEFVQFISHSLKGSLSKGVFSVDYLESQIKSKEAKSLDLKTFEILKRNLGYLNNICDRILNISTLTHNEKPLTKTSFDLLVLIKECIPDKPGEYGKDFSIETEHDEVQIIADKTFLRETFSILLDNAIKYGGDIIKIVVEQKEAILISFMDNGPGVPRKLRKKIFDKYHRGIFQKNESLKGSGLGLFYAKSIIELHKGNIQLKFSEPWTIFQIKIPRK